MPSGWCQRFRSIRIGGRCQGTVNPLRSNHGLSWVCLISRSDKGQLIHTGQLCITVSLLAVEELHVIIIDTLEGFHPVLPNNRPYYYYRKLL